MEPSLKNGDILLIRRADFPAFRTSIGFGGGGSESTRTTTTTTKSDKAASTHDDSSDENDDDKIQSISDLIRRSRQMREVEYQHHRARENSSVWFRCPPSPMKGQIVTYRSPYQYPTELCVKRVVGVEGQVIETTRGLQDVDMNSVWVEGDNHDNSSDSRNYGAVSQKLVLGVAEYVLWPPSRIGKLAHQVADEDKSYWP